MFPLIASVLGEAGSALGARAAVGMGAAEGGFGARLGASLGEHAGLSAARHLSDQFNNRNNQDN